MNRKLNTVSVPIGQPVTIAGPGRYLKIVRTFPIALVIIATDDGQTNNAVAGTEIEFKDNIKSAVLTCPGALAAVQVQYYVATFPHVAAPKVEPQNTLSTSDWITTGGALGAVILSGTLVLNGTTYRRKNITVVNMNGLAGMNAAQLGILEAFSTARNAFTAVGTAFTENSPMYPLLPATATQVFPFTLETDDSLLLSPNAGNGPIDFSIVQTWLPVTP